MALAGATLARASTAAAKSALRASSAFASWPEAIAAPALMEFSFDSLASACAFACSAAETRDSAATASAFAASSSALVSLTAFTASCSRCCASASFAARPVRMSRFDCASSRSVWEPVSLSAATPVSAFAASTARWASARARSVASAFCSAAARTVAFST